MELQPTRSDRYKLMNERTPMLVIRITNRNGGGPYMTVYDDPNVIFILEQPNFLEALHLKSTSSSKAKSIGN